MEVGAASYPTHQAALQSAQQSGHAGVKVENASADKDDSGNVGPLEALGSDKPQGVGVQVDVKV